jgi:hypothetical protein
MCAAVVRTSVKVDAIHVDASVQDFGDLLDVVALACVE